MRSVLKRLAVGTVLTAGCLAVASPAMAIQWGSEREPYYIWENNVAQGMAWGDFGNYNFQYARSNSWQYDLKSGGQAVFVSSQIGFLYEGQGWGFGSPQTTRRTTSSSWVYGMRERALAEDSEKSRARVKACEDHIAAADPCSATGLVTFSY